MAQRRKVRNIDTNEVIDILIEGKKRKRRETYKRLEEATGLKPEVAAALGRSILNDAAGLVIKRQVGYKKTTREED
jgi:hypothetical protein